MIFNDFKIQRNDTTNINFLIHQNILKINNLFTSEKIIAQREYQHLYLLMQLKYFLGFDFSIFQTH